jgi:hypothetical protein
MNRPAGRRLGLPRGLCRFKRYLTVVSWCTYPPVVYISEKVDLAGNKATWNEQIGLLLPFADVVAKAVLGILTWANWSVKLTVEESDLDRSVRSPWPRSHIAVSFSCSLWLP